jgi:hypothetical protein
MRKLVLLVLSSAMLLGGLYLLVVELLFESTFNFGFIGGGGALAFAGGYLIWTDFGAALRDQDLGELSVEPIGRSARNPVINYGCDLWKSVGKAGV